MITKLSLEHFKCFENLRLNLAPLTLLTGVNAAGKSSVIQSLVLLHQSRRENAHTKSLVLNGALLRLGRFSDIVDYEKGRDCFTIGVTGAQLSVSWQFQSDSKELPFAPVYSRKVTFRNLEYKPSSFASEPFFPRYAVDDDSGLRKASIDLESDFADLFYLSTERIGPRETYQAETSFSEKVTLGASGELTPWFLSLHGEQQVPKSLCLNATTTLVRQVEAWLADFFPGAGLELKTVEGTGLVTLHIRTSPEGRLHRPQNVGYGLTQLIPILAACLGARPGQIVIIENPEAHLHPTAQAKMGRFLSLVAASGVQLILESHSDHILNGIRRSVKAGELKPEDVVINFFQRRDQKLLGAQIISPTINAKGVVDQWPTGFFDQFDRDLSALTEWDSQ